MPSDRGLAAVGFGVALLAASPAIVQAQPSDVGRSTDFALEWSAPESCPSKAEVVSRVTEIVGVARRNRRATSARVVVEPGTTRWRARVDIPADGSGDARSVDGESCSAVADAVAVIVALSIDPEAANSAEPRDTRAQNTADPRPPNAPTRTTSVPDQARNVFFVGAAFAIGTGELPSADLGPAVVAGWRPRHVHLGAELGITSKVSATTAEAPSQGATFWIARGGLRSCGLIEEFAIAFGPCAGLAIERTAASGFGSRSPADGEARVAVASLGALALWEISSRTALRATLEATAPLARPTFVIEGTGIVHRSSAIGARAAAGLELHF